MEFIDNTKQVLKSEDALLKKTLIGTLVLFASILILPYFIYQGYLMRILKQTDEMPDGLPEWSEYGGLFKDGLIAFGISVVLSLPATLLNIGPQIAGASEQVILLTSGIGSIISLIVSYLLIAILTVGFRDGFKNAVTIERLKPILFSQTYLIYWVVAIALGLGVGILAIPIVLFTFGLGIILLIPLFVLVNFVTMTLAGLAITEIESGGPSADERSVEY